MSNKLEVTSLEDVPEGDRDNYVKGTKDGATIYRHKEVANVLTTLQKQKLRNQELHAKLEKLSGVAKDFLPEGGGFHDYSDYDGLTKALGDAPKGKPKEKDPSSDNEIQELRNAIRDMKVQSERDKVDLENQKRALRLDKAIDAALRKNPVDKQAEDLTRDWLKGQLLEKDGRFIARDPSYMDDEARPLDVKGVLGRFVQERPRLAAKATGTNIKPKLNSNAQQTITNENWESHVPEHMKGTKT